MTWYSNIIPNQSAQGPHGQVINREELTMSIPITNLHTEADEKRIASGLLALTGVKDVQTFLHQKRISLTYNPSLLDLGKVAYTLSKLGYHHVQRG